MREYAPALDLYPPVTADGVVRPRPTVPQLWRVLRDGSVPVDLQVEADTEGRPNRLQVHRRIAVLPPPLIVHRAPAACVRGLLAVVH